jgi:hypothetical protein
MACAGPTSDRFYDAPRLPCRRSQLAQLLASRRTCLRSLNYLLASCRYPTLDPALDHEINCAALTALRVVHSMRNASGGNSPSPVKRLAPGKSLMLTSSSRGGRRWIA